MCKEMREHCKQGVMISSHQISVYCANVIQYDLCVTAAAESGIEAVKDLCFREK